MSEKLYTVSLLEEVLDRIRDIAQSLEKIQTPPARAQAPAQCLAYEKVHPEAHRLVIQAMRLLQWKYRLGKADMVRLLAISESSYIKWQNPDTPPTYLSQIRLWRGLIAACHQFRLPLAQLADWPAVLAVEHPDVVASLPTKLRNTPAPAPVAPPANSLCCLGFDESDIPF